MAKNSCQLQRTGLRIPDSIAELMIQESREGVEGWLFSCEEKRL
jgi:hypothetical protein